MIIRTPELDSDYALTADRVRELLIEEHNHRSISDIRIVNIDDIDLIENPKTFDDPEYNEFGVDWADASEFLNSVIRLWMETDSGFLVFVDEMNRAIRLDPEDRVQVHFNI